MNSAKQQIIDKIKKLLRMKRGGTQAEIETALALAAELARKHGIDLGSVDPDAPDAEPISHVDAITSARIQWECKFAMLVCQQFFNVEALLRAAGVEMSGYWRRTILYKVTFIGTSWDTQIAIYVYSFLVGAFRRAWATRRGRARNRHVFMHAMYHGICEKLDAKRQEQVTEAGLVLIGKAVQERKGYMQKHWPNLKDCDTTPDSDAIASKLAGYLAGRDTEIRSGLTETGKSTALLE